MSGIEIIRRILDVENNEQDQTVLYESAEKMSKEGKFEEAVLEFSKIIELAPRTPLAAKAAKSIGDIYNEKYDDFWNDIQDNEKALQYYEKAIEIDPNYLEAYFDLGGAYFNQNNWDEALEQYNKVLNSNPSIELKAKCISEIGFVYVNQEKYDDALGEYFKIVDLDVDNKIKSEALRAIGEIHTRKEDTNEALAKFREARELDNTLDDAHLQLAEAINIFKDEDKGLDEYNKIIESNPNSELAAKAYIIIGDIYFEIKEDYNEAEKSYKEAIKICPNSKLAVESFLQMGEMNRKQKKYDEAIENYKSAIKIDPNSDNAHYYLADSFLKKKMHKEALWEIDEAIRLNPKDAGNHNLKGVIFWKKQYQKAIEEFNKAIELDPTYYWPHLNLARLYKDKKQNEKAIDEWINCLKYAENKRQKTSARKNLIQLGVSEKDIEKRTRVIKPFKETFPPIKEKINPSNINMDITKSPNDIAYLSKKTYLEEVFLEKIKSLLEDKHQLIFYGVPGTGKTFVANQFANFFTDNSSENAMEDCVKLIQFHQSYGYEDFIEGIRPITIETSSGKKEISYVIQDGIFKEFCKEAQENKDTKYLMIIDEINRGNTSKIFGELLYLLEYRKEHIRLPYSKELFSIPDNVYIIGTMNTADRSIAFVDYALRRRFYFVEFKPGTEILEKWLSENPDKKSGIDVPTLFNKLNAKLINDIDAHHQIGHSYFMIKEGKLDENRLKLIWDYNIIPLLKEYFFTRTDLNEYSFESMIKG